MSYRLAGGVERQGRVLREMAGYPGVQVVPPDAEVVHGAVSVTVRTRDIVRVEVPTLTDKERFALSALHAGSATLKGIAAAGTPVAPKTMSMLARRGLVDGITVGVARVTAMVWGLTDEGRRVVRDLGN